MPCKTQDPALVKLQDDLAAAIATAADPRGPRPSLARYTANQPVAGA